MRALAIGLAALVLLSAPVAAQVAGDGVVYFYTTNPSTSHLLVVTPQGAVTTVLSRTPTQMPDGLAAAPANRGCILAEKGGSPLTPKILQYQNPGGVSTLASLPTFFTMIPTLMVEQGGDILILNASGVDRGVYRMPARGGPVTTVAHNSLGASFVFPFAMEEDLLTGDIVVLDTARKFHRIDRTGKITTIGYTLPPSVSVAVTGNVHVNHATGLMILTFANYMLGLDPGTGATTTLQKPTPAGRSLYLGLDADPYSGGFYLTEQQLTPQAAYYLKRYDAGQNTLSTVATLPTGRLSDVATWESRMLSGFSRPAWGQSYNIALSIPAEAGKPYLAAAALGTLIGIPVGGGRRVPLDADALFFLSQQAPGIFASFTGVLDAGGLATPTIHIPGVPQLAGFRFFVAAVTYDTVGVRVITEPLGVTIE